MYYIFHAIVIYFTVFSIKKYVKSYLEDKDLNFHLCKYFDMIAVFSD